MPTSSRIGGCTFAEDPDQSCAFVRPVWSATVDPRVLVARMTPAVDGRGRLFDTQSIVRRVPGPDAEHLLVDRDDELVRLDIVGGLTRAGPATLRFDLVDDDRIEHQLAAMTAFRVAAPVKRRHDRLARKLTALLAFDAQFAGASLRETADLLLGPGDWPGDGEYRKSCVRRLIADGREMVRLGPRAILAARANSRS